MTVKLQTNLDRLTKARTEAAAEGDKAEKARKRAEVYEARAQKAQAELDEITAELIRLRELQNGIRDENLELARAGRELDRANGLKATEGERLDEALAQKKNEYRELEEEESRLGAEIGELERLVDAALRVAAAKLHEWRDRAKEAAGAAKAAVSRAFEGLPPLTPAARRRASVEAWYETESADPRRAIEHLRNVLATNTDALGRRLAENYIAQHEAEIAALQAEADLRAVERPEETVKRHAALADAAETARRERERERPLARPTEPSPEPAAVRLRRELAKRQEAANVHLSTERRQNPPRPVARPSDPTTGPKGGGTGYSGP